MQTIQPSHRSPAFLLIVPGALLLGFAVGLAFANPAPGVIGGLGVGLLIWGLIVAVRR